MTRKFLVPSEPPPPPMAGVLTLIVGAKRKERTDNNGCVGVYTDLKKDTETYMINDVYVERRRCSTDDEEAMFEEDNPGFPVSIRGLKKIPLSRPPTPPRAHSDDFYDIAFVAENALAYFNKKHNTDYKLVKTGYPSGFDDSDGYWMHVNFTAKSGAALGEGNGDSSTKHFFAEGKYIRGKDWMDFNYEITACCILDGVETTKKCGKCPDSTLVSHPTRGRRRKGRYFAQPRVLRPRQGSKVVKI